VAERIVLLPGDGIGPEVTEQARRVMVAAGAREGLEFEFQEELIGGCSIDAHGTPLRDEVIEACRESRAILLGAVGGPKWDDMPVDVRPEKGLLGIRKALGLFANLRPAAVLPALVNASALRPEIVEGVDLLVVRELTGGIYFGEPRGRSGARGSRSAVNAMVYDEHEIERITRVAFEQARLRRRHVTHVHKANVLEVSQLWMEVVDEVAADYPDVELAHQLVDSCAMLLVQEPRRFDVIVTGNLFGDILSDEAAMITGSLGMLPSASLATGGFGVREIEPEIDAGTRVPPFPVDVLPLWLREWVVALSHSLQCPPDQLNCPDCVRPDLNLRRTPCLDEDFLIYLIPQIRRIVQDPEMAEYLWQLVIGKGRQLIHVTEMTPILALEGPIKICGKNLCTLVKRDLMTPVFRHVSKR